MKDKKKEMLEKMSNTKNIRNATIIAHVDHGKTTLSDSLLAQDGLMNIKNVGIDLKLDGDPIEKKRKMTVYSSYVTILYERKFAVDNSDFFVQCQTCGLVIFQKPLEQYRKDFKKYSKDKPPEWYSKAARASKPSQL